MIIKLVIFTDNIYPDEHVDGLCLAASKMDDVGSVYLIGQHGGIAKNRRKKLLGHKAVFISERSLFESFKAIVKANLVFGMPKSLSWMRILSSIRVLKFLPYFFGPGFVTKAVGFFKHPERGSWPMIKTMMKFYVFNTYFLCSNNIERIYYSAALGYPLTRCLIAPVPKHIYINSRLKTGDEQDTRHGILFAPTHRWGNIVPPLTTLMTDSLFLDKLFSRDFLVFHSRHPESKKTKIDVRVQDFNNDWDKIRCVITDYSSIGEDFLSSGGKHVIAYMPDKMQFEAEQGVGPMFSSIISKKIIVHNREELDQVLEKIDRKTSCHADDLVLSKNYFQKFLNFRKNM